MEWRQPYGLSVDFWGDDIRYTRGDVLKLYAIDLSVEA